MLGFFTGPNDEDLEADLLRDESIGLRFECEIRPIDILNLGLLTWHHPEAPPLASCLEFRRVPLVAAQRDTHGVAKVHFLPPLLHLEHGL
jgi:hypothetical protein